MAYRKKGLSPSGYLLFLLAFMITFTFNLPHLYFHGFNSLGESSSSFLLAKEAFSGWERTPFLPFPNLIFYLIDILNYFGYLFSIIILAGLFNLWKNERKYFLFFSAIFLVILLILSVQKNWIEGDKYRIIICSFLSLLVFFAYGLKYIFTVKKNFKRYLLLLLFLIILSLFSQLSNKFDFKDDTEFYTRKFLYQTESPSYYRLAKKYLTDIGLLPNYKRLYSKLDIRQKRKEEAIILKRLFPEGGFPGLDKFGLFYAQWEKTLYKSLEPSFKKRVPGCYNYIKINFEKLADNLYSPVEKVKNAEIEAIDLKNIDTSIFNVYYANLSVSWQKEKLPVAVILNEDELDYLKELYIDLNAFISLDTGPAVFEKVYPINFKSRKLLGKQVPGLGMETFPLYSERNTIIFHVPSDLKIVIRNWFVNEKGNPYKIDSWIITPDKNGNYRKEFNYNEPESYL
jgi:diacylglycerol kinase